MIIEIGCTVEPENIIDMTNNKTTWDTVDRYIHHVILKKKKTKELDKLYKEPITKTLIKKNSVGRRLKLRG